jgi:hypothetical protein
MSRRRRVLRHVFEDLAEVAEADGGVDALGHLLRLHARRPTSARERIVQVDGFSAVPRLAADNGPTVSSDELNEIDPLTVLR